MNVERKRAREEETAVIAPADEILDEDKQPQDVDTQIDELHKLLIAKRTFMDAEMELQQQEREINQAERECNKRRHLALSAQLSMVHAAVAARKFLAAKADAQ
jgi:hypothetical protein